MKGRLKDTVPLAVSGLALALSVYATFTAERRASDETRRTIRTQLTDVLGRLTSLQLENAKLMHEGKEAMPCICRASIWRWASRMGFS